MEDLARRHTRGPGASLPAAPVAARAGITRATRAPAVRPDRPCAGRARLRACLPAACAAALVGIVLIATPAAAASGDLNSVIDSIRTWVAGLLAGLATLFLTIGGVRYLTANGNARAAEEGKEAIRSALIGYALAALAPLFVDILRKVLGT